jgi:hypothetical protein
MITTILLNWQRPEMLNRVIESIRKQTIESKIWIWDNSGTFDGKVDSITTSVYNIYCLGRWKEAKMVRTEYTFTIDDDMIIKDTDYFERLIEHSKQYPDAIFGYNANVVGPDKDKPYWSGCRVADDQEYEQINTGVSFWPTRIINELPEKIWNDYTKEEIKYADDIIVSHYFKHKRCAPWIYNGVEAIDVDQHGLSKQSEHMPVRDRVYKRLFL